MKTRITFVVILVAALAGAAPLGTEFTYQGVLSDGGAPASGAFDFRFFLYDADAGGSQVGSEVLIEALTVTDGRITTQLDFGDVFDGTALWLEVGVRDSGTTGAYIVLSPRQELTAAPFSQHAQTAETAGHATTAGSAATAGHATTAGDADTLGGQSGTFYLTWSNLENVPQGLDDGDDDTLAGLSCGADEIARWNGSTWSCFPDDDTPYVRTYVVGPVGTPIQNGAALSDAMGSITTPFNQETAAMLRIEPGVYDLGTGTQALLPWIVIEGAGRDHTRVTSAYCGTGIYEGTYWSASNHVVLRGLTVENTCADPASHSIALSNQGDDLTVEDVRLIANQGAHRNYAMFNSGHVVAVKGSILQAENGTNRDVGLRNLGIGVTLEDVTIHALGGGVNRGIENEGSSFTLERGDIQVWSGVSECTGFLNTDADLLFVYGLEVKIWCSSSSDNGLLLHGSSATLRNVIVSAGDTAIGLHNPSGSNKSVRLHEIELEAAVSGTGIWCQDEGSSGLLVTIQRSQIRCTGGAVYNHLDQCTVRIGASHIEGGVTGTATCAGVYDGSYTFFADTCPSP